MFSHIFFDFRVDVVYMIYMIYSSLFLAFFLEKNDAEDHIPCLILYIHIDHLCIMLLRILRPDHIPFLLFHYLGKLSQSWQLLNRYFHCDQQHQQFVLHRLFYHHIYVFIPYDLFYKSF